MYYLKTADSTLSHKIVSKMPAFKRSGNAIFVLDSSPLRPLSNSKGRIQDFARGGGRDLKSILTSRVARLLPREARKYF